MYSGFSKHAKKMRILAILLTAFVAVEHIGILILEMFFWNHPVGQKVFNMTPEVSAASATLAMNQGLYNGFLAAGLFLGTVVGTAGNKAFLSWLYSRCRNIRRLNGKDIDPFFAGFAGFDRFYSCLDSKHPAPGDLIGFVNL